MKHTFCSRWSSPRKDKLKATQLEMKKKKKKTYKKELKLIGPQ